MAKITTWLLLVAAMCVVIAVLLWFLPILPFFFPTKSETVLETWESRRGENGVVVTAKAERNSFVPGVYYSFEAVDRSNNTREIMTFRHDDPVPINRNGIFFLDDKIWYVFMGWKYAVTTDGGSTWSVWSADEDLPGWECCNYELIQDVRITLDGKGTMKLKPIPHRPGEVPELYTKDYGRHWNAG